MGVLLYGPAPADVREFDSVEDATMWWEPGCTIDVCETPITQLADDEPNLEGDTSKWSDSLKKYINLNKGKQS